MRDKDSVGDTYSFGSNVVDFKAQEATTKAGERIQLSKKEAMLLKLLIENKNEVVPREKILQTVWGYNVYPTTRTIDNFILNFRKYFETDSRNPQYFHSVRGWATNTPNSLILFVTAVIMSAIRKISASYPLPVRRACIMPTHIRSAQ